MLLSQAKFANAEGNGRQCRWISLKIAWIPIAFTNRSQGWSAVSAASNGRFSWPPEWRHERSLRINHFDAVP